MAIIFTDDIDPSPTSRVSAIQSDLVGFDVAEDGSAIVRDKLGKLRAADEVEEELPTLSEFFSNIVNGANKCKSCLTKKPAYYIVGINNLSRDQFSVIKVDDYGAFEVDRAYRNVREALEQWPEAIPPRS